MELDRFRDLSRARALLAHLPVAPHDHAQSPAADDLVSQAGIVEFSVRLAQDLKPLIRAAL